MTAPRKPTDRSLGFGIEKIGLLAVRAPWLGLLVVTILTVAALAGIRDIRTGGTLLALFRSDTPEFARYDAFRQRFPASDRDILLIVQGDDFFASPERLEQLRSLHVDLQLADPVASVLSFFTVPDAARPDGYAPPLMPEKLPSGESLQELGTRAASHPLIRNRLLARLDEGNDAALFIVSLKAEGNRREAQAASIAEVGELAEETLTGPGLAYTLAGTPVMETEIRETGQRDRMIFNLAGLAVGILVCFALFRRFRPVFIVTACPVTALVWALGVFGWLELELSTISNAVLPLVIALTFCDAMHMVYAMRRHIGNGESARDAAARAVQGVGPACVLTSLTTSLALLSLLFADSEIIGDFAISAAVATVFALLAVLLLVPLLGSVLLKDTDTQAHTAPEPDTRAGVELHLEQRCTMLAHWLPRRAMPILFAGAGLTLLFLVLHLQLHPSFRLSAQLPDRFQARQLSALADSGLDLTYPVQIVITTPEGVETAPEKARQAVGAVHDLLARQPLAKNVWSAALLDRWLASTAANPVSVEKYLEQLPPHLKRRFQSRDGTRWLVTGYLPDLNAQETLSFLENLNIALRDIAKDFPGFTFSTTGLAPLAAVNSTRITSQLNQGLLTAIILVCLLLGLAFRSLAVPLVSVLPNVLPLVMVGAVLSLAGRGLDYTTLIALTVAFGIAVDNAIHFLNRLHIENRSAAGPEDAVAETIARVGPVLLATTLVLMFGIGATVTSDLPPTRVFGLLCLCILAAALLADLVLLPAIILALRRLKALPEQFLRR